jgi:hypothetical protein
MSRRLRIDQSSGDNLGADIPHLLLNVSLICDQSFFQPGKLGPICRQPDPKDTNFGRSNGDSVVAGGV